MTYPLSFTLTQELGQCAADALADTAAGPPTRVCLIVPGEIADDECDCGQLALAVPTIYPSRTPPLAAADDGETGPCGMPYLVTQVLVRIMRGICGATPSALAPTCEQLELQALVQHEDMQAIRRAVGCCLHQAYEENRIVGYLVGAAISQGPLGNCVGSQLQVAFWTPHCSCPEEGL